MYIHTYIHLTYIHTMGEPYDDIREREIHTSSSHHHHHHLPQPLILLNIRATSSSSSSSSSSSTLTHTRVVISSSALLPTILFLFCFPHSSLHVSIYIAAVLLSYTLYIAGVCVCRYLDPVLNERRESMR